MTMKFNKWKLEEDYIIIPVGNKIIKSDIKVNEAGMFILEKLENGLKEDEIIELLDNEFRLSEEDRIGVKSFIDEIKKYLENIDTFSIAIQNSDSETNNMLELQNYYFKRKKPYKIFLELTYECNYMCQHCYIQEKISREKNFIAKEKIFKVIDELESVNVVEVFVTGGEATLHPEICEILEYQRGKTC